MKKQSGLTLKPQLNKKQITLIFIISIFIFILVYSPHFSTPFPTHVDEWHHITEAIRLKEGEYNWINPSSLRSGFHLFLSLIGRITDLVLIYRFLPAIWAVLASIVLFFITYNLTNRNFLISILSMLFFGSIKSNINLLGLWFFTPLTFSIPFIFLYFFFFIKGLQIQNKNYLLASLGIMLFLIPIHSLSVLFAIPILVISSIFYLSYIKKEYKFFLIFLLIPFIGILFYSFIMNLSFSESVLSLLTKELRFDKRWGGITAIKNSFTEIYSLSGYFLTILGVLYIFVTKKKNFYPFVIWPIYLLISIFIFRITDVSYLSPYQRNFYYLAISLPILSALGVNYILELTKKQINKIRLPRDKKEKIKAVAIIIILLIVFFLSFKSYKYKPSAGRTLFYVVVTLQDYEDLAYLSNFPKANVLAENRLLCSAIKPVSGHDPVATIYFYHPERRGDVDLFYSSDDCDIRNSIIERYNIKYVISIKEIDCGYNLLSDKNNYIYEIND